MIITWNQLKKQNKKKRKNNRKISAIARIPQITQKASLDKYFFSGSGLAVALLFGCVIVASMATK